MGKYRREKPQYFFEKGNGTEYCHSCSKTIRDGSYCVKWAPRAAFGEPWVVLCIHCSIDIGELGNSVKNKG